jgi:ferredoxin
VTVTYDPRHPQYFDEADLRGELNRVYDLCHGCRLCWNLCTSFPTLFEFVDAIPDQDVEKLTKAQQDQVVDECFQCKICYVKCPYIPPHEWELDFPRLMLRAAAVKKREAGVKVRITDNALGRTDLSGTVGSLTPPGRSWRRSRASPPTGCSRPTPGSGSPRGSRSGPRPASRTDGGAWRFSRRAWSSTRRRTSARPP